MQNNVSDFRRPASINQGVLLNTNNDALNTYKKTKKRLASVTELTETVKFLLEEVQELRKRLDDRDNNTD